MSTTVLWAYQTAPDFRGEQGSVLAAHRGAVQVRTNAEQRAYRLPRRMSCRDSDRRTQQVSSERWRDACELGSKLHAQLARARRGG